MKSRFDIKQGLYLLAITLPVLLVDQVTKVWALSLKGKRGISVFDSWFHFIYAENRGALFSFGASFPDFYRKLIFLGFSSLITIFILFVLFMKDDSRLMKIIYALVLGGALGNLYDRFFRGYVIDFIDWHIGDVYHWPTFNIADVAIVVAVALVAVQFIFFEKKRDKS